MTKIFQNKHLSQVFLKTNEPCIRAANIMKELDCKAVLEIGPGKGILTKELIERFEQVLAVERDDRFFEYLTKEFAKESNIHFINGDILKIDLTQEQFSHIDGICGNIPYHISSGIIQWVLPHLPKLKGVGFLVQKEFAERLCAKPGTKAYGSFSIFAQLQAEVKLEFVVDKSLFIPVPKVDSAFISMRPLASPVSAEVLAKVEKTAKICFSQRRKKLSTSLKSYLKDKQPSVDLNRRCETLSLEEFVILALELN